MADEAADPKANCPGASTLPERGTVTFASTTATYGSTIAPKIGKTSHQPVTKTQSMTHTTLTAIAIE